MIGETKVGDKSSDPTTLEQLYAGTREQLLLEAGVFSRLTDHPGEKGKANEEHLRNVPPRIPARADGVGNRIY